MTDTIRSRASIILLVISLVVLGATAYWLLSDDEKEIQAPAGASAPAPQGDPEQLLQQLGVGVNQPPSDSGGESAGGAPPALQDLLQQAQQGQKDQGK